MNCPNCKIELHPKRIQGIEIEECGKCEGIWFEDDELKQMKDKIDSDLNWMDFDILKHPEKFKPTAKRTNCPSCKKSMDVLDYDETKVEIDYCAFCKGIWLEKNELEKIIEALEKEILTKSLNEYISATMEEAKSYWLVLKHFYLSGRTFRQSSGFCNTEFLVFSLKSIMP